MGASGRAKIEAEWNYDTAFAPVMSALLRWLKAVSRSI